MGDPGPIPPWEWRRGVGTPRPIPVQPESQARRVSCDCRPYGGDLVTCEAAMFYFRQCGLRRLDGDNDGIPGEPLRR